jgi:hypothetical protein
MELQGDRHHGFFILYGHVKKNEDTLRELILFIKERISIEDEVLKFMNKNLNRVSYALLNLVFACFQVNTFINNNGAFVDSWRLSASTLELYAEIQTTLVKTLMDLQRDIIRYHDELVKARKAIKDKETVDAVNLMQTTTTCLQKAKETYHQRCNELANLKHEPANSKELLKVCAISLFLSGFSRQSINSLEPTKNIKLMLESMEKFGIFLKSECAKRLPYSNCMTPRSYSNSRIFYVHSLGIWMIHNRLCHRSRLIFGNP